jgi:hypothetical protein
MTTTTRSSILRELVNLDPCGAPLTEGPGRTSSDGTLPGLPAEALLATVQLIDPPRRLEPLVWGVAGGRTMVFRADDATIREMQSALAAGDEPTAIVQPCQIVSLDL